MIFEKTYDKITNSIDFQISQAFETRNWDKDQIEIKKKRTKEKKKMYEFFFYYSGVYYGWRYIHSIWSVVTISNWKIELNFKNNEYN